MFGIKGSAKNPERHLAYSRAMKVIRALNHCLFDRIVKKWEQNMKLFSTTQTFARFLEDKPLNIFLRKKQLSQKFDREFHS